MTGRKIGFTLAQCEATPEEVKTALERLSGDRVLSYHIAQEKHEDGNHHIHGFVEVIRGKRFDWQGSKLGPWPVSWHKIYNVSGWLKYIKKEGGAFVSNIDDTDLMKATNDDDLFERLKKMKGMFTAMTEFAKVHKTWARFRKQRDDIFEPYYDISSFNVPDDVLEWKRDCVDEYQPPARRYVLLLCGPTRLGKTQMMRTMFPDAAYCKTFFSYDTVIAAKAKVLILDDLHESQDGSAKKPPNKAWTAYDPFNINGKYRQLAQIPPMAVVILCNEEPEWLEDRYWKRNCFVVSILEKLY